MDYKDYLSKMQDDINKKTKDILEQSQYRVDSILNKSNPNKVEQKSPASLEALVKDQRLEAASQAKLGTFEKLYNTNYVGDSKVPMYGYDDIDYASLVNLLASALELELNMSLYQVIRKQEGIQMPENAFKDTKKMEIKVNGLDINLGKSAQMYGALIELFKRYRDVVGQYVDNPVGFIQSLSIVADVRNDANHTVMIEKERFLDFYQTYSILFNHNIGKLLTLKTNIKEQKKSRSHKSYTYTGTYNAEDDDYIKGLANGISSKKNVTPGIIFTDTRKLALKYEGEINYVAGDKLFSVAGAIHSWLRSYAEKLNEIGITYSVLDLADGCYDYILNERNDWKAYLDILDDISKKLEIDGEHPAALFIIGGTDVIPMPQFHNPGHDPISEANNLNCLDSTVDADFPYSYSAEVIKVTAKGELSLDALSQEIMTPRFYVGRLPLESGYVKTNIEGDLKRYLERALAAYSKGGIQIDSPLMTTCKRTIKVGTYMTEGFPLFISTALPDDMQAGQMVTSPSLSIEKDPRGRYEEYGLEYYKSALSESDMLIFLLHGGGHPSSGSYVGDYKDSENNRIQPTAYDPALLQYGKAKCIATVCCFGAKFIGYSREYSTLLSSIYRDTLSFMGSSRSAYGEFDDSMEERGVTTPPYSVRMMRLYLQFLFSGIQGGEALAKAKAQYINGVTSWQIPDDIPQGLTTILEFNYYGDPMLWMKPKISVPATYGVKETFNRSEAVKGDKWSVDYEPVGKDSGQTGLLARIRSMVDRNFEEIHSTISDKLYKEFGLEPREFYGAHKYSTKCGETGYSLQYRHTEGVFYTDTFVKTDLKGNVISMYHTY